MQWTQPLKRVNLNAFSICQFFLLQRLTWFCTVIVSRCLCNSTIFVSSNMAAIFFESGTRTLFSLLLGLLISPSSLPSWFSSSFNCFDVLGADEIAESSTLDVLRSFCGLLGMDWKFKFGRFLAIGDMIVSRDVLGWNKKAKHKFRELLWLTDFTFL